MKVPQFFLDFYSCLISKQYFLQSAANEVVSGDDDVPLVSTDSLIFRKWFGSGKLELLYKSQQAFVQYLLISYVFSWYYSVLGAEEAKAGRERRYDRPLIQFI